MKFNTTIIFPNCDFDISESGIEQALIDLDCNTFDGLEMYVHPSNYMNARITLASFLTRTHQNLNTYSVLDNIYTKAFKTKHEWHLYSISKDRLFISRGA